MSDRKPAPDDNDINVPDLEFETHQCGDLRAEMRKLKVYSPLSNRLFTTILPISALLIAQGQIYMAYQQKEADCVSADHDEALSTIELHIARSKAA
jgi:hypothetical protein